MFAPAIGSLADSKSVFALQDFKVLYPTLSDYEIRYYIYLLLIALDYSHSQVGGWVIACIRRGSDDICPVIAPSMECSWAQPSCTRASCAHMSF